MGWMMRERENCGVILKFLLQQATDMCSTYGEGDTWEGTGWGEGE